MNHVVETLKARIGTEIGVSDWITIDQARIDAFAQCTQDFQWIHIDPERAAAGPFGATIAHGFLTLSLIPYMTGTGWLEELGVHAALNYGIDKARFLNPVVAGARIRNRRRLTGVEEKGPGRALVAMEHTIEIDGSAKPALVATMLAMVFT